MGVKDESYVTAVFNILMIGVLRGSTTSDDDTTLSTCLKGLTTMLSTEATRTVLSGSVLNQPTFKSELNELVSKLICEIEDRPHDVSFFEHLCDLLSCDAVNAVVEISTNNVLYLVRCCATKECWDAYFTFVNMLDNLDAKMECVVFAVETSEQFPIHRLVSDVGGVDISMIMNVVGGRIILRFDECSLVGER